MTLFETVPGMPSEKRAPRSRAAVAGIWALVIALVSLLTLSLLPSAYVIESPGPVYNTLGTVRDDSGKQVPVISVTGAPTHPTSGQLSLLTVSVSADSARPSWLELLGAFFDGSRAIVPADVIYPPGQTEEQNSAESAAQMTDSQQEATAAALRHLGYTVPEVLTVADVPSDSASAGLLQKDDVLVSIDGIPVTDYTALRDHLQEAKGAPARIVVSRGGAERTVTVTPRQKVIDGTSTWLLGVSLATSFDFPIDVKLQLFNVGGPSAGQMFALGIIDTLSTGDLNGGKNIAGTGTIDAGGTIGEIGGIRQKMWGARRSGAEYFLAPAGNCDEVTGHIPAGLRVFAVKTLDDSLHVLDTIRTGGNLDALPTCPAS